MRTNLDEEPLLGRSVRNPTHENVDEGLVGVETMELSTKFINTRAFVRQSDVHGARNAPRHGKKVRLRLAPQITRVAPQITRVSNFLQVEEWAY